MRKQVLSNVDQTRVLWMERICWSASQLTSIVIEHPLLHSCCTVTRRLQKLNKNLATLNTDRLRLTGIERVAKTNQLHRL